jgi:hypothetical protein
MLTFAEKAQLVEEIVNGEYAVEEQNIANSFRYNANITIRQILAWPHAVTIVMAPTLFGDKLFIGVESMPVSGRALRATDLIGWASISLRAAAVQLIAEITRNSQATPEGISRFLRGLSPSPVYNDRRPRQLPFSFMNG